MFEFSNINKSKLSEQQEEKSSLKIDGCKNSRQLGKSYIEADEI